MRDGLNDQIPAAAPGRQRCRKLPEGHLSFLANGRLSRLRPSWRATHRASLGTHRPDRASRWRFARFVAAGFSFVAAQADLTQVASRPTALSHVAGVLVGARRRWDTIFCDSNQPSIVHRYVTALVWTHGQVTE